ncbi:DEAD/DEAH box helicase family protein [Streptomyces sp. NPDC005141]
MPHQALRPHQIEAVDSVLRVLSEPSGGHMPPEGLRAQVIAATGSGKTLIGVESANRLSARRVLVCRRRLISGPVATIEFVVDSADPQLDSTARTSPALSKLVNISPGGDGRTPLPNRSAVRLVDEAIGTDGLRARVQDAHCHGNVRLVERVRPESSPGRGPKNRPAYLTYVIGQVHLYGNSRAPAPAMNDQERLDKESMCVFPGPPTRYGTKVCAVSGTYHKPHEYWTERVLGR